MPNHNQLINSKGTNHATFRTKELATLIPIEQKLKYTPVTIEFDVDYYSTWAKNITAKYRDLVVTKDILTDINKGIANLNKFKDTLNRNRIDIANEIKAPIDIFEAQVKSVIAIVVEATTGLKVQTEAFEVTPKAEAKVAVAKLLALMLSTSDPRTCLAHIGYPFKDFILFIHDYIMP